jgi:hypothetical protein
VSIAISCVREREDLNMLVKNLAAFFMGFVLLTFGTVTATSQEGCKPFGGTLYGWHNGKAWVGEGEFTVAGQVLRASVVDVNTGVEKHSEMWWGTETATFDFGKGNTVQLLTEFTTEHMTNPSGVFHVNEIGTLAKGTGRFRKAYGHFNSQGPFGPGVVLPAGKVSPPAGVTMYWIGHYDGTICGLSESKF